MYNIMLLSSLTQSHVVAVLRAIPLLPVGPVSQPPAMAHLQHDTFCIYIHCIHSKIPLTNFVSIHNYTFL